MNFHPILFSTEMVKAILEGRKTQTRRVVKGTALEWLQPNMFTPEFVSNDENNLSPYGYSGDVLWVRENWKLRGWTFEDGKMNIGFTDGTEIECDVYDPTEDSMWLLKQVEQLEKIGCIKVNPEDEDRFVYTDKKQPFKPSIHMPKTACRIFLQIKSIRVERLQDISEADAKAEGVLEYEDGYYKNYCTKIGYGEADGIECIMAKGSFQTLWMEINGIESWRTNPFVWVIEFQRIDKPSTFNT